MRDEFGIEYSIEGFIRSLKNDDRIIIFGAGKYGLHIYDTLRTEGIRVDAISDNNKAVLDGLRNEYPVKYVEDITESDKTGYFVIGISRLNIVKAVEKQLKDMGIETDKIIIPIPTEKSGFFDNRIMIDEEYCMLAVREMWNDVRRMNNNHIVDYFETNDLFRIAVFETDMFKGWLDDDLKGSKVSIVEKPDSIESYKADSEYDAIIILNELMYEVMEEKLMRITTVPIISIWDLLKC